MNSHSAIRRLLAFALSAAALAVVGPASASAAALPSVGNVSVSVTPGGGASITGTVNGQGEAVTYRGLWHSSKSFWCSSSGITGKPMSDPAPIAIPGVGGAHVETFEFTNLPIGEELCAAIEATNETGTTIMFYDFGFQAIPALEIPPPSNVNANAVPAPAPRCFVRKNLSTSKTSKGRKYTLAGRRSASSQAFTFSIAGAKGVSYSLGSEKLKAGSKSPWSVTIPATAVANHAWLYASFDTGQTRIKLRIRLATMTC